LRPGVPVPPPRGAPRFRAATRCRRRERPPSLDGHTRSARGDHRHRRRQRRTVLMTATSEAQDSWAFAGGESPSLVGGGQPVTLVEETSFCLSTAGGDIEPGSAHGLFFLDTRFLSALVLR